jgi:hypothetical protein
MQASSISIYSLISCIKKGFSHGDQKEKCLRLEYPRCLFEFLLCQLLSGRNDSQDDLLKDDSACGHALFFGRFQAPWSEVPLLDICTAEERGPLDLLDQVGDRNPSRAAFCAIEHRTAAENA